jgi:hypothetical protein
MPPPRIPFSVGPTAEIAAQRNREEAMLAEMRGDSAERVSASKRRTEELGVVNERLDDLAQTKGTRVPKPGQPKIALPKNDPGQLEEPIPAEEAGVGGPLTAGIKRILQGLGKTEGSADDLIDAVRGTDPEAAKILDQTRASEAFRDHDRITADDLEKYTLNSSGSKPDLPMDEGARMGREKEWSKGYQVFDGYHGTDQDIEAFAVPPPFRAGRMKDNAVFFSADPDLANSYATWKDRRVTPMLAEAKRKGGESATIDTSSLRRLPDEVSPDRPEYMYGANVVPTKIRMKSPLRYDAKGALFDDAWKDAMRRARDGGHDGVIMRNVDDWGDEMHGRDARGLVDKALKRPRALRTVYAVFDPSNVRSRFASFDPSQEGSSRLLAGIGGGMVFTGGLYLTPQEAEAQEKGENSPVVKAGFEETERQRLLELLNGIKLEGDTEATGGGKPPNADKPDEVREIELGVWGFATRPGTPTGTGLDILKSVGRGVRGAAVNAPENMAFTANDIASSLMTHGVADPEDPFTKLFAKMTGNEEGLEANRKEFDRWNKNRAQVEEEIVKAGDALDQFAKDKTQFLGESENVPEALIEGLSQFLVGFIASKKIAGTKSPTTIGGNIASGAVHGTVAENTVMDPMSQSLIGVITEAFPEAKNPLTSFFTVQPDDRAAVARLKKSLEGVGLGIALDAVILPLAKAVRSSRDAKAGAAELVRGMEPEQRQQAFEQAAQQLKTQKVGQDLGQLGDPSGPAVSFEPKVQAAGKQLDEAGVSPETMQPGPNAPAGPMINFARIDAPEDIDTIIGDMAKTMGAEIDEARRGVQTFEATRLEADEVDAWDTLAKRRPGEPLNAEQSVAVRELWVSSGRKLREVSMAAAADPSPGNIAAARRMLAIYQAVQSEVISARTETARALSSWRIPVSGTSKGDLQALDDMIGRSGGETANAEFFKRLATADAKTMSNVAERGVFARTGDALYSAWINGLLSGPKSHVTNALSGFQMLFLGPMEKAVAGGIRAVTGGEGVRAREALTQIASLPEAFREAWVYAGRVAKLQGEQIGARLDNAALNAETDAASRAQLSQKINAREAEIKRLEEEKRAQNPAAFSSGSRYALDGRPDTLSARAWGLNPASSMGIAMDALTWGIKWPGKAMQFADELFKVINYRMEVNALSMRRAQEAVEQGATPQEAKQLADQLRANPPEDIRMQGADYAMYQTFTTPPTDAVKSLHRLLGKSPALRLVVPFVNTPANIFRYSLERTPLAPFMRHVRDDIKAGGTRRQMALARMTLGNLALFSFMSIASSGGITGKGPASTSERQTWARTGAKPYSAKIGDSWVTYSRADPIGFSMGLAADIVEISRALGDDEDEAMEADVAEIIAVAGGSIAQNILNKSFMSGISDVFEWASDPVRYGSQTVDRMGTSIVPAWMAESRRQMDPVQREVGSFIDAFRNRIPGLSQTLPARLDMWGREMEYASGLGSVYDTLSPLYVSKGKAEPIDTEMQRLGLYVGMPPKTITYDGVPIKLKNRPKAWSRYLQLSGNELTLPQYSNMGAKDFLNATIEGKSYYSSIYKIYGPERRQKWIRNVVEDYRDAAKDELLDEYPEIAAEVDRVKAQAQAADMDALSQGIIP